ncbi:MAG: hypothetical protein ACK5L2_05855, partial [Planctomyces sp.]
PDSSAQAGMTTIDISAATFKKGHNSNENSAVARRIQRDTDKPAVTPAAWYPVARNTLSN